MSKTVFFSLEILMFVSIRLRITLALKKREIILRQIYYFFLISSRTLGSRWCGYPEYALLKASAFTLKVRPLPVRVIQCSAYIFRALARFIRSPWSFHVVALHRLFQKMRICISGFVSSVRERMYSYSVCHSKPHRRVSFSRFSSTSEQGWYRLYLRGQGYLPARKVWAEDLM